MKKIKKEFSLFFAIIFLYQSTAFCFPEKNSALRPPLYFNKLSKLEFRSGNIDIEKLGKPTVIFEDDIMKLEEISRRENIYLSSIIEWLGVPVDSKLGILLGDVLLELVINGLDHRLTKQEKAVHLKVISYSRSGEKSDLKRTIRFTIEQKSSKDSDWQELAREKAGFDNKGGLDYLQDYERRKRESINRRRTKLGLRNVAKLMQNNHPVLLRYVRSLMKPYPIVTDFYYELPADQKLKLPMKFGDIVEMEETFRLLQAAASKVESIVKPDYILKTIEEAKNGSPYKFMEKHYEEFLAIYRQISALFLNDEDAAYMQERIFVDTQGEFIFEIEYDFKDKFAKAIMLITPDMLCPEKERKHRLDVFVKRMRIYLKLFSDIVRPGEDMRSIIDAASTMKEGNGQPEKTYRFLALYYTWIRPYEIPSRVRSML